MSEAWESTRDFAHIRHPKTGSPALCAFIQYKNNNNFYYHNIIVLVMPIK